MSMCNDIKQKFSRKFYMTRGLWLSEWVWIASYIVLLAYRHSLCLNSINIAIWHDHWFHQAYGVCSTLWLSFYEVTVFTCTTNLTHWGRATHICVGKLTTIGSDNGLSPRWRQVIIWTIAGILLIGPLGTNFSEIKIGIQTFSSQKMHLKMSSAKWRPSYIGLNVLVVPVDHFDSCDCLG